jgi:glycosyltransferase involved in cell wall biosynthesis
MRILLLTGSYPPMRCGVGDYVASLADALGRLGGTEVAVITDRRARGAGSSSGVQVFPIAHGWEVSDLRPILTTIRQWAPDVLHLQYPTQGYADRLLPWVLPLVLSVWHIPVVQTWHEHLPMGTLLRSLAIALAPGRLVVVRPHYEAALPPWARFLVRPKRPRFIPNASSIPRVELRDSERRDIRRQLNPSAKYFVAYFGFIHPNKSVELLFDVLDPEQDHLVLIGQANQDHPSQREVRERTRREPWRGKVTVTDFLPEEEVARLLGAVDAVLLPFRDGGGLWNTSLQAAAVQGTFVLTTSRERQGYDPSLNVYFSKPGDITEMRSALRQYIGRREASPLIDRVAAWESIAQAHTSLYRDLLGNAN